MKQRAGFTLIELSVSLAVSGLLVLTLVQAVSTVVTHRARAEEALERVLEAARARELLHDVLSGAFAEDRTSTFYVRGDSAKGVPNHAIGFMTRHVPGRAAASALVHIYIDRDTVTAETGLVMSFQILGEARQIVELAPSASGLSIKYQADDNWVSTWHTANALPRAIELVIIAPSSTHRILELPIIVATTTVP